jgi:Signal transduction histidine kinase
MKTIEFNPDGKSTVISAEVSARDDDTRNEVLLEVLPLILHKLKNKLTPILGYAQILKSRSQDEFLRERLERIERNTAEMAEHFNTLKDYGRRRACPLRPAAIGALLQAMAPEWQAVAGAASARVVIEIEPELPDLPVNEARLRVLLLDLVANAARALGEKPSPEREIRICLRRAGGALKLSVRDNGGGMNGEEMALAWTPFHAGFPGGAGLGLSLCEKVIADHGASGSIASSVGEFSEVTVTFPLPAVPVNANPSAEAQSRARS